MQITTKGEKGEKVITIRPGERLDLTTHSVFCQAAELASHPDAKRIVVDLRRTRQLRDSGLSMLLMLYDAVGRVKNRINLVNCCPTIRRRLLADPFRALFNIS